MTEILSQFDSWLTDKGPAALVIREPLVSVEGADGVLFPPTFAAGDHFAGGYNIDVFPEDKDVRHGLAGRSRDGRIQPTIDSFPSSKNVCLVDSAGSQANRIEPIFAREEYAGLVPQVVVQAGEKAVNLLEIGHRAGDAFVRCSALQEELQDAFKAVLKGNAQPLAKLAPTSLVFGVWDSRDTQARLPRLVSSTIRAFDVRKLTRSAQYKPPLDYSAQDVFSEEEQAKAEGDAKNPLARRGFVHVPAAGSPGGVIATGGIRRDATLSLAALRLLAVRDLGSPIISKDATQALRRYILGLALVAFTFAPTGYLRQGCNLILDPDKPREMKEVYGDGRRLDSSLTHDDALAFAAAAAGAFGVGLSRTVPFEPELAQQDVQSNKPAGEKPGKRKGRKGKG